MPYILDRVRTHANHATAPLGSGSKTLPSVHPALVAKGKLTNAPEHEQFHRVLAELATCAPYPCDYAVLGNATAYCEGFVRTKDGVVYENGGCFYPHKVPVSTEPFEQVEQAITLVGRWGGDIWHYPMESLVGLMAAPSEFRDDPATVIHVSKVNKYIQQWTEIVGVDPRRLRSGVIRASRLCVPRMGECGAPYPEQVAWLRNHVARALHGDAKLNRNTRLVVLVKRNRRRPLLNHNSLETALQRLLVQHGMAMYIHDDASLPPLKEQMKHFRNADLVVAPHGGSAVLMSAMSTGSTFVEMMDLGYTNVCSLRLAYLCGLRYIAYPTFRLQVDINGVLTVVSRLIK